MDTYDKLERAKRGDTPLLAELAWEAFRKADDSLVNQTHEAAIAAWGELQIQLDQITKLMNVLKFMDQNVWHPGHLDDEGLTEEEKAEYLKGEEPIGLEVSDMLLSLQF